MRLTPADTRGFDYGCRSPLIQKTLDLWRLDGGDFDTVEKFIPWVGFEHNGAPDKLLLERKPTVQKVRKRCSDASVDRILDLLRNDPMALAKFNLLRRGRLVR